MSEAAKSTLHVAFNLSAAGTMRQVLRQIGSRERVIGLMDNLSMGPINPPAADLRRIWFEDTLGTDWEEVLSSADSFWDEIASPTVATVIWVSRRSACEYSGLLEFLWRSGDSAVEVIDVTDMVFNRRGAQTTSSTSFTALSLGELTVENMIEADLPRRRAIPSRSEIDLYRDSWRRLKAENAALRVIDDTGLVSAPIDRFDNDLVSFATDEWRPARRIVGETMVKLFDESPPQSPGDLFLWARVRALEGAGVLDLKGDRSHMRDTLVRRAER
jgi:hypothetical protein